MGDSETKSTGFKSLEKAMADVDALITKLENGTLIMGEVKTPPAPKTATNRTKKETKADKKSKKKAASKEGAPTKTSADAVKDVIQKANLIVALVERVEAHPSSDKLVITQLDCGDHKRQIVAGLQQYIDVATFGGSKVVCIINLKTAKLGGEISEGMILASTSGNDPNKVSPIVPPNDAEPGTMVFPENLDAPENADLCPKTLKGELWRSIVPKLSVKDGVCQYDGAALKTQHGYITAPGLESGTIS